MGIISIITLIIIHKLTMKQSAILCAMLVMVSHNLINKSDAMTKGFG